MLGVKTGGRQRGTPNKKTQELSDLAETLGCNPFEVLLRFAMNDAEGLGYEPHQTKVTSDGGVIQELTISPELRASCAEKACRYMFPQLKAVEVSGGGDSDQPILVLNASSMNEMIARNPLLKKTDDPS